MIVLLLILFLSGLSGGASEPQSLSGWWYDSFVPWLGQAGLTGDELTAFWYQQVVPQLERAFREFDGLILG